MNQAYWPVVVYNHRQIFLRDKDHKGVIKEMQLLLIHAIEVVHSLEQVFFDQLPTVTEKAPIKPSGPGALSVGASLIIVYTSASVKGRSGWSS
jgi:hypothetical protein